MKLSPIKNKHKIIKSVDKFYKMEFGMHKGKSIKWLIKNDPGYVVWLFEENILKIEKNIYDQSKKLKELEQEENNNFIYLCWSDMEF